ncbi:MAG: adenylate/guanylate cyclase domain-containing protein [Jaaginema sp. PMC 1079.18]|nr:adenylate/guanylate cyclase domain-containing protein [Jaaginema sp. PMC 1080.18]MEC4851642.1 adenylate/guanylate cyclase domain-containing protein [Jaaginema sp. PMC 1079.18]MEC4866541.1 adenylate/guanylate cyclase domain-containing protein [Jaaginema sp. PMC 1078.18]
MAAPKLPIGVKIFGIAASMLGLLLVVVSVSSNRLRLVNQEIATLAEYIIPITDKVAQIDVHSLEQERLLERILRHYESNSGDRDSIAAELAEFRQRDRAVDGEVREGEVLIDRAIADNSDPHTQNKLEFLRQQLIAVEQQHQDFHDRALEVFRLFAEEQTAAARQVEQGLIVAEADLDRSIAEILLELEAFTVAAAATGQQHQNTVQQIGVAIAILATAFGSTCAGLVTLGLVRPVRQLTDQIQAVQQGNLDRQAKVTSQDEIATLAAAFNRMVQELKVKAQLEETFGKYVDPRVVKQLINKTESTTTTGDRQVMTVCFSEVKGLDSMAQNLGPQQWVEVINQYLTIMSQPITERAGVIDKFINTVVMSFFGPPFAEADNHANLACEAALRQRSHLQQIQQLLPNATTILHLQIGIATGNLVVGNMGSANAKSYTVMGDTVNIASRLKGVSQQYGVAIALSQETQELLSDRYATRELDTIQVVGKTEPVRVYELLGYTHEIDPQHQTHFALGLAAYRQQQWDEAATHFSQCSTPDAPDPPAQLYLKRIQQLRQQTLPPNWDGIWQMTQK